MTITYLVENRVDLLGLPYIFSNYEDPIILVSSHIEIDNVEKELVASKYYTPMYNEKSDTPILGVHDVKKFFSAIQFDHVIGGPSYTIDSLLLLYENVGFIKFIEFIRRERVSNYIILKSSRYPLVFESLLIDAGLNRIDRVDHEDDFYNTISNLSLRDRMKDSHIFYEINNIPEYWSTI